MTNDYTIISEPSDRVISAFNSSCIFKVKPPTATGCVLQNASGTLVMYCDLFPVLRKIGDSVYVQTGIHKGFHTITRILTNTAFEVGTLPLFTGNLTNQTVISANNKGIQVRRYTSTTATAVLSIDPPYEVQGEVGVDGIITVDVIDVLASFFSKTVEPVLPLTASASVEWSVFSGFDVKVNSSQSEYIYTALRSSIEQSEVNTLVSTGQPIAEYVIASDNATMAYDKIVYGTNYFYVARAVVNCEYNDSNFRLLETGYYRLLENVLGARLLETDPNASYVNECHEWDCCADKCIVWLNRSGGWQNYYFCTKNVSEVQKKQTVNDYKRFDRHRINFVETDSYEEVTVETGIIPKEHLNVLRSLALCIVAYELNGSTLTRINIVANDFEYFNSREKIVERTMKYTRTKELFTQTI